MARPLERLAYAPGGPRHERLIHVLEENHQIAWDRGWVVMDRDGAVVRRLRRRPISPGSLAAEQDGVNDGWQAYVSWDIGVSVILARFEVSITVPDDPGEDAKQQIYLFPGMQSQAAGYVLQPVLQWGRRSQVPGSGPFWGISSWWAPSAAAGHPAVTRGLTKVNPGDQLCARISATSQADGSVAYLSEFVDYPATRLPWTSKQPLDQCVLTLETYGITDPGQYPGGSEFDFTNIVIQANPDPGTINWRLAGIYPPSIVSYSANGGEVDIKYPLFV